MSALVAYAKLEKTELYPYSMLVCTESCKSDDNENWSKVYYIYLYFLFKIIFTYFRLWKK